MIYLELLQQPVPASRPRVGRYGVYYGKNYTKYRKEMPTTIAAALEDLINLGELPLDKTLLVAQLFEAERPRTTILEYPLPDVDNFIKALWDALQKHGVIKDDKKIIATTGLKRWTTTTPKTHVLIRTATSQDMKHALNAPPQMLLEDIMTGMVTALAADTTNTQKA